MTGLFHSLQFQSKAKELDRGWVHMGISRHHGLALPARPCRQVIAPGRRLCPMPVFEGSAQP
jgi:hypothetical protein